MSYNFKNNKSDKQKLKEALTIARNISIFKSILQLHGYKNIEDFRTADAKVKDGTYKILADKFVLKEKRVRTLWGRFKRYSHIRSSFKSGDYDKYKHLIEVHYVKPSPT